MKKDMWFQSFDRKRIYLVCDIFHNSHLFKKCITTPQAPPNFLRAAALGEYKKPVVVMPSEERYEEEEVEPQPEFRESPQMPQVRLHASQKSNVFHLFSWSHL